MKTINAIAKKEIQKKNIKDTSFNSIVVLSFLYFMLANSSKFGTKDANRIGIVN